MLRQEVFREMGGFDERLAVAFNNVNLYMRSPPPRLLDRLDAVRRIDALRIPHAQAGRRTPKSSGGRNRRRTSSLKPGATNSAKATRFTART